MRFRVRTRLGRIRILRRVAITVATLPARRCVYLNVKSLVDADLETLEA